MLWVKNWGRARLGCSGSGSVQRVGGDPAESFDGGDSSPSSASGPPRLLPPWQPQGHRQATRTQDEHGCFGNKEAGDRGDRKLPTVNTEPPTPRSGDCHLSQESGFGLAAWRRPKLQVKSRVSLGTHCVAHPFPGILCPWRQSRLFPGRAEGPQQLLSVCVLNKIHEHRRGVPHFERVF